MFSFPPSSRFDQAIPKARLLENNTASARIKKLLTSQIGSIRWLHKLSPTTINLPGTKAVPEIQIFHIILKGDSVHPDLLDWIDQTIPQPIIYQLENANGHIAISAAHKRPSEADHSRWVTGERFTTGFAPPSSPLPVPATIDLGQLYTALIATILPLPRRTEESLPDLIQRCQQHRQLQRQIDQLQSKIQREKQFNRKVALNSKFNDLKRKINDLS